MKKFNIIKTTKKEDDIIIDLSEFLYSEYIFSNAASGIIYIYEKKNHVLFQIIHWYELMRNNILPDLIKRVDKLSDKLYNLTGYDTGPIEQYHKSCDYLDDLDEFLHEESNHGWKEIFKKLSEILIEIKTYEDSASDYATHGKN